MNEVDIREIILDSMLLRTYHKNCLEDRFLLRKFPSKEDSNSFVHSITDRLVNHNSSKNFPFQMAFFVVVDSTEIGYLFISSVRDDEVYLEYFILPEYRGYGYGKRLVREVTDYLFANYNIRRIKLDVDPSNQRGISLAQSCGYVEDVDSYLEYDMKGRIEFCLDNYNYIDKRRKRK